MAELHWKKLTSWWLRWLPFFITQACAQEPEPHDFPCPQSSPRRPTADRGAGELWARDWQYCGNCERETAVMANRFRQFRLLLWKNFLLQVRLRVKYALSCFWKWNLCRLSYCLNQLRRKAGTRVVTSGACWHQKFNTDNGVYLRSQL